MTIRTPRMPAATGSGQRRDIHAAVVEGPNS